MKIVVLNECFLSAENISYLKSFGDLEMFVDTASERAAIERMAGADIVLADMYDCPLNAEVLGKADKTKLVCVNSTGFDLVSLETAAAKGISVANTPGFSTEAVAEHTFALLLAVNRHIVDSSIAMIAQPFQINPGNQQHNQYLGMTLAGKTIGIVGLGAIGQHVAGIAHGFGMQVAAYNRSKKDMVGVKMLSLDELYAQSDIISLNMPLNDQSQNLIDVSSIEKMKDGVIIINTARGGCLVTADLAKALHSRKVGGAGLDILDNETFDNPILQAPNCVITPHSAWFTQQALGKIGNIMIENVKAFIMGKEQNIVSQI